MKQIYLLGLSLIFIISCSRQNKTDLPKEIPVAKPENNNPVGDHDLVIQDAVSTHGPRNITRNVLQDRNGNIWLASWEGIIRYDGNLFTNFTLKEGLEKFNVHSVLEDRAGNLWFGTVGGGVYRYDPSASLRTGSKSFTNFTTTDHLAGNSVMCMLADKAGNIWFGTTTGVSRYDGYTFTNFTTQDGLSSNAVYSIIQDKTGKLWFGTNGGVSYCYDPSASLRTGGKIFTDFTNKKEGWSFHHVRSIIEDKTGNIWIGSSEGLWRYDPSASLRTGEQSLTNFPTQFPMYIFEDRTGNLWLSGGKINGREMTLFRYDGKTFTEIKSDLQIFGITEDRAGNIWFGTARGVCRYDPSAELRTGEKSFTDFLENVPKQ